MRHFLHDNQGHKYVTRWDEDNRQHSLLMDDGSWHPFSGYDLLPPNYAVIEHE